MVKLTPMKIIKLPTLLKLPELLMGFIILMIARLGGTVGALAWGIGDSDNIFGDMVCYGYFLILIVQLIGTATDDRFPVQNTVFALLGFLFWLSLGSVQIADAGGPDEKKMKACGSLCILNSFIYAAEGVLHGLNLRSGDEE